MEINFPKSKNVLDSTSSLKYIEPRVVKTMDKTFSKYRISNLSNTLSWRSWRR